MLFKAFLIEKILRRQKTKTRRLVKKKESGEDRPCQYKPGHLYFIDRKRFQKDHDGRIKVIQVTREILSAITKEDVIAEGFEHGNVQLFIEGFKEINKLSMDANPDVWVIEFELVNP